MVIEMELLGSSSGAEGIGQLVQRPQIAVQALASSVCHCLLGASRWDGVPSDHEEPGWCVGSTPTPSEMDNPPELLPESFTYKVANTFPYLWSKYKTACLAESQGEF